MQWFAKKKSDGTLTDIAFRDRIIWNDGSVDVSVNGPPSLSFGYDPIKLDANGNYISASTVNDDLKRFIFSPKVITAIIRCLVTLPATVTNNFPADAKATIQAANTRIQSILNNRVPSGSE